MFGTLVSTDFDQGSLEFIENPDPVAAVSRNLQDRVHIACMFCRFKKVRCSGGRKKCQRCVAMGLECVYPENQGRNKRQENNKSRRRATIQRNSNIPARISCDEAESCARNGQAKYSEELALDGLHDMTFDDNCIDEALFTPWSMNSPMQQSLDGSSRSGSVDNPTSAVDLSTSESPFSTRSRSTTVTTPPGQFPELSTVDATLTSLLSPPATDGAGDLDTLEGPHVAHGDMSWAMNADGHGMVGSTSEPPSFESWGGKMRTEESDSSCCCLMSSISFLEKLVSRSASRENRIDVLLADFRGSIEALAMFIACERCAAWMEQNMLLAMASRQISVICEKTANCYKAIRQSGGLGDADSPTHQQKPELDGSSAAASPVDVSVSAYRVNRRERLHLLKSLVTLQISEFQQHINTIKSRYRNRPDQGQVEALTEAENYIKSAQVAISSHS